MEWLSLTEYLPPLGVMVLIKDREVKSVGRIVDMKIVVSESDRTAKKLLCEWTSIEPHVFHPTHWMHIPK